MPFFFWQLTCFYFYKPGWFEQPLTMVVYKTNLIFKTQQCLFDRLELQLCIVHYLKDKDFLSVLTHDQRHILIRGQSTQRE